MFDHVSLQVQDVAASRTFYEAVLLPLGIKALHADGAAVGFFGEQPGSFWIAPAERGPDRELHIAFHASSREQVRAFHRAAAAIGAEILHEPRAFPEYHLNYYGAFIRDPDGHNIEAVCHEPSG